MLQSLWRHDLARGAAGHAIVRQLVGGVEVCTEQLQQGSLIMETLEERLKKIEAELGAAEPWAIGKRAWNRGCRSQPKIVVADSCGVTLPEEGVLDSYSQVIKRGAKDLVPWDKPPDRFGVVAVVHPAAWSTTGQLICEGLAKRFATEVHVFWHGSNWYMVFLAPLANERTEAEQRQYDKDYENEPKPAHDDGGFYVKGSCKWWAVVNPKGQWKNLAAS